MALNPSVSYQNLDASIDTSFNTPVLIIGQSNTATAGLYKDIEFDTIKDIETKFGKNSHLSSLLKDAIIMVKDSQIKPKIMAVSYQDNSADVARVLTTTISGTATENKTLQIKINAFNPDRIQTQIAIANALRITKGADCSQVTKNGITIGKPSQANMQFNAPLNFINTNDIIINVDILKTDDADAIATKITSAISSNAYSLYNATSTDNVITLTARHKGEISQNFTLEFLKNTIASGMSIATIQTTAGSGAVDISDILTNVVDNQDNPLGELDFNFVSVPYAYNINNLVADSYAKWLNVFSYGNRAMDYLIIQAVSIDLSNNTAINALQSLHAPALNGITRQLCIVSKVDFVNRGVSYTKRALIESKQFTPIQKENDGKITVGNCFTLSDEIGFIDVGRVLSCSVKRQATVEKFIPEDYSEKNYTTGTSVNDYTISKSEAIAIFQKYRDIFDGSNTKTAYEDDYAGLTDNSTKAREDFDTLLEAKIKFDVLTKTLFVSIIDVLINPIQNINIVVFNK